MEENKARVSSFSEEMKEPSGKTDSSSSKLNIESKNADAAFRQDTAPGGMVLKGEALSLFSENAGEKEKTADARAGSDPDTAGLQTVPESGGEAAPESGRRAAPGSLGQTVPESGGEAAPGSLGQTVPENGRQAARKSLGQEGAASESGGKSQQEVGVRTADGRKTGPSGKEDFPEGESGSLGKADSDVKEKPLPPAETSMPEEKTAREHPADREELRIQTEKKAAGGKTTGKNRTATYKEKILRHKKRRYRRTIFLVLLLTALLVSGVILWMRRGYTHAELNRIVALAAEDGASYENLGGNVVQYSNSGAICIDSRGNTLWNVSYEMQQPITSVSGNVIAIANRSGYYIYVMNTQGLMGTIQTTLPIHNIAAADNGEVAVIMNDTKATWIRLYTAGGREIAYIVRTMAENGYPVAAAVSPDGETLCLSSVQMSNAAVKTNISFFNFGKAGQKVDDHLVEHSDFIDEVIPYMHYFDNTTCVCVSDKQLFCFWNSLFRRSGSTYVSLPDNMQGVFCGDNFIGILSNNTRGDSQYTLELFNKRGKSVGSVHFTMQYTDISIAGDKVYINNEQQCQVFTIGGRCLFDGSFGRNIRALIPGADLSDLLVVTGGEVDSVRLH